MSASSGDTNVGGQVPQPIARSIQIDFSAGGLPLVTPADRLALLEALLLVAPEPPTVDQLAATIGIDAAAVEDLLADMEHAARGWILVRHRDTVQLASAPRFAEHVRFFLGLERTSRLSGASLETLAMIAYRQPATRAEIEAVRGVDCASVLATLHGRGLIETVGRLETVGHPIQYGTTPAFLRHFGLTALSELPPLGEVEGRDATLLLEAALSEVDEDGSDQSNPSPPEPGSPSGQPAEAR